MARALLVLSGRGLLLTSTAGSPFCPPHPGQAATPQRGGRRQLSLTPASVVVLDWDLIGPATVAIERHAPIVQDGIACPLSDTGAAVPGKAWS